MKTAIISAILFISFFINMQFVQASPFKYGKCSLKKNDILHVGCTKKCSKFNRWGLKKAARRLGYKIQIHNIYNSEQKYKLEKMDGILIPGGVDISPEYYISKVEPDLQVKLKELDSLVNYTEVGVKRDKFEYGLLNEYFSKEKLKTTPILGICRGMQMLAVSQGVPLYIDIEAELGIKNRKYDLDKIRVQAKKSEIYKIMKRKKFKGVEVHHQGPRVDYFKKNQSRWPNVRLTGLSHNNRVAEVLEWTDRPVLGVQFHPEYTSGVVKRRIFNWFLRQSCHNKKRK